MHEQIILLAKTYLRVKDEEYRGTERKKSISR